MIATQFPRICSAGDCSQTPEALSRSLSGSGRRALYSALARVWMGLTAAEAELSILPWERRYLELQKIAIERERALSETRFLVQGGLEDLAAFHKTGLKREELVALVGRLANLALLGAILDETD